MSEWRCPDCSLVVEMKPGVLNKHDPGCPTAANDDAMLADDRKWFEDHPELNERHRPVSRYDMVELNWQTSRSVNTRWAGVVTVRRGPVDGTRWRDLSACYPLAWYGRETA